MRIYYKQYIRCPDDDITTPNMGLFGAEITIGETSFTFNGLLLSDGTYTSAPSWFSDFNLFPAGNTYWIIDANGATAGQYFFSYTGSSGTEYLIEFVKLATCQAEFSTANCKNKKTLFWLTREGGWSKFVFSGKTTYEVTIPEGSSFSHSDYVKRYGSRNGVYRGELVTTGDIPEVALDLLESLKYSTQAYLDESTDYETKFTPIYIEAVDFIKRKTGDKRFDVSVRFIYAESLPMQSQ